MAIATVSLAIFTYLLVKSNREKEDRDRKERLLNEIIEWAENISKCGVEASFRDILEITTSEVESVMIATRMAELNLKFKSMSVKNKYINNIVVIFGQDLMKAVEELIRDVTYHVELLNQCKHDAFTERIDESSNKVNEHKLIMDQSVNNVIENAVKIKVKI